MRLIVDFTSRNPDGKMFILSRRHILFCAVGALIAACIAVYAVANAVAAYWITSNAAIAIEISQKAIQKENEDKQRLWRESLGILEEDIAVLNARVSELYSKGVVLSERLGLPGDKMFANNHGETAPIYDDSLLCNAGAQDLELEERQAEINSNLLEQTDKLGDLENKYGILRDQEIHHTVSRHTLPLDRPLLGNHWLSSRYGYRRDPFSGRRAFHSGDDYAARRGTPIVAAADGIVIYAGRLGNYGNAVHLYHGGDISTLYGHMHKIQVGTRQYIRQGEIIGSVGSTGRSTGPHLHYEVRINNRPQSVIRTIKKLKQQRNLAL